MLPEGARTRNRCPCLLPKELGLVPYMGRGEGLIGGLGCRGGLGGPPTLLVVLGAGITRSTLLLHLRNGS